MSANAIAALRITIASPEQIRSWSSGEITKAVSVNYRTLEPEDGGLFCEHIFGPTTGWSCACGKHRRERAAAFLCERCGSSVVSSSARRQRMGHIELATPVAHPWFARTTPSALALLLDCSPNALRALLAYNAYLVLSIDEEQRQRLLARVDREDAAEQELAARLAGLVPGAILEEAAWRALHIMYGKAFYAQTGAEAIGRWLDALDLDVLAETLRQAIGRGGQLQKRASKRLALVEAFRASGVRPAWMILSAIPVLPPELRPLVRLESGRFATSDVNALYERVIHRNLRVQRFLELDAPEPILNHERRLLQRAVDALFDNGRCKPPVTGPRKQPLRSLTDLLKGKRGRFRRNLLGKRVDYSGRSVIVAGPALQLHQCGLPVKICRELFKPFVIRRLVARHAAPTIRAAKRMVERAREEAIRDALREAVHHKVVLLNRAPTLHRLGIQAFEVVLVEGSAIQLHPLVCSAFNADFDGDQMAVHLPLSEAAQAEARALLLSTRNLRSPAAGAPAISISQDIALGLYYLTQERPSARSARRVFADAAEALLALEFGVIDLHTHILVRTSERVIYDAPLTRAPIPARRRIETTAGRLIFNSALPEALRFKNYEMTKERLQQLLAECLRVLGESATATLADALKTLGFTYATRSGTSFAISDIEVPPEKHAILARAEEEVGEVEEQFRAGMIASDERSAHFFAIWTQATDEIDKVLTARLNPWGVLATLIKSGATKAKFQQIRQLSGIRGLMARPSGEIIDIPIRGNYLEGLTIWEAFIAASAARAGFMARSLNTKVTGHLTRKLVEAGMEVWVTMEDCGTRDGLLVTQEESQAMGLPDLRGRVSGRVLAEPVAGLAAGLLLDETHADQLLAERVSTVRVRSVLTCQAPYGVCRRCYGTDLATGKLVQLGAAVGIVAGQSIGEPGTQLSMRAFHSGGIAHAQGDIRAGLVRVIDLYEAYPPAQKAILAPQDGRVSVTHETGGTVIMIANAAGDQWCSTLPAQRKSAVADGQQVEIGTPLTGGAQDLQEILGLLGCEATARYLIGEIQQVFRGTGVFLNDKHIECIVRQMLRYVAVSQPGDTTLLPGAIVDRFAYERANAWILAQGGEPALARPVLFGLTKAILQSSSWVAAAAFQETSRVLTHAAISGQRDGLYGFKERQIVGERIPSRDGARMGAIARSDASRRSGATPAP